MLSAIVATTSNGVIGVSGELPWYLPADLKHFKEITTGHTVIMGRKTYDSIVGRLGHALPDRENIVITRGDLQADDIKIASSIKEALEMASDKNPIIIGGAQIYELAGELIDRWYITEIDGDIEGDVFLKAFDQEQFSEVSREDHAADEKNQFNYHFIVYERK